jgi:hypothetical protein
MVRIWVGPDLALCWIAFLAFLAFCRRSMYTLQALVIQIELKIPPFRRLEFVNILISSKGSF